MTSWKNQFLQILHFSRNINTLLNFARTEHLYNIHWLQFRDIRIGCTSTTSFLLHQFRDILNSFCRISVYYILRITYNAADLLSIIVSAPFFSWIVNWSDKLSWVERPLHLNQKQEFFFFQNKSSFFK